MTPLEVVSLDVETFSDADLPKVGAHVYASHPSTEVLCLQYAFGDEPMQLWTPGMPCPPRLRKHIESGGLIAAWNANFERLIFWFCLCPKYGFPRPKLEQFRCTMARAYAMSFPGSLEKAAEAMKLPFKKDKLGSRIMRQLCQRKKDKSRWTPENAPQKFKILYDYCAMDVEVERAAGKRLVPLSEHELDIWFMDQRMNDRGVYVNLDLVEAAKKVAEDTKAALVKRMREVTEYAVSGPSAVADLKTWLASKGCPVGKELRATDLEELLVRDDLAGDEYDPITGKRIKDGPVRLALEIRQEFAKTSVSKLDAFLRRMDPIDNRVRGTVQYHGATTGRWAARGVQTQNFPRPSKKADIAANIEALLEGDFEWIMLMIGPPMSVISDTLRPMIQSEPGKRLFARDLSQIEARVVLWLAGDMEGLKAFILNDRGEGPDVYIVAAAAIYNVPVSSIHKDDPRRQVGKVAVLALGFEGGAVAFAKMAKVYRVQLAPLYDSLVTMIDTEMFERVECMWNRFGRGSGMGKRAYWAAEIIKQRWRAANPLIVQFWKDLKAASINAVLHPGKVYTVGRLRFKKTGSFLRITLPSGRHLWYPYPRVETTYRESGTADHTLYCWGVDSYTNKWCEYSTYGGFFCENVVQATARDIMADALLRQERAGYPPVMTIHDEAVNEVDENFGNEEEYTALFVAAPHWAGGLPIASDGWVGNYYRK